MAYGFTETLTSSRGGSSDRLWGAELWSIFSHDKHKIVHAENTKTAIFYKTSSKFRIFGKVASNVKNEAFFARHLSKYYSFGGKFF